jgi:hypothetical protein
MSENELLGVSTVGLCIGGLVGGLAGRGANEISDLVWNTPRAVELAIYTTAASIGVLYGVGLSVYSYLNYRNDGKIIPGKAI